MVSSYTANLAAFLTVESVKVIINNAEELANSNIKYGAKRDGSTYSFFKDAEYPVYEKMYNYMKEHTDDLTTSNQEGIDRVKSKEHNYAFLVRYKFCISISKDPNFFFALQMESSSIEYITERECEVAMVGKQLDEKGYGIAMRKRNYCSF